VGRMVRARCGGIGVRFSPDRCRSESKPYCCRARDASTGEEFHVFLYAGDAREAQELHEGTGIEILECWSLCWEGRRQ